MRNIQWSDKHKVTIMDTPIHEGENEGHILVSGPWQSLSPQGHVLPVSSLRPSPTSKEWFSVVLGLGPLLLVLPLKSFLLFH